MDNYGTLLKQKHETAEYEKDVQAKAAEMDELFA